jgi:hypothetical protein
VNSFVLLTAANEKKTHLLWDASTQFPAYTGLYGERDVVQLNLVRTTRVLCIPERVREDLCGVPMREFEKLV